MLKTIKTTKQIDFFELVKGVQAGIYKHGDYRVIEREEGSVWIDLGGFILEEVDNKILYTDLFEVEIEEPIDEDTVFDELHVLQNVGGDLEIIIPSDIHTIRECLEADDEFMETFSIYTHIGGYPIKIWERE